MNLGNAGDGEDTLFVVGNALSQTFNINANAAVWPSRLPTGVVPALTVQVDDANDGSLNGTVTFSDNESLQVYGLEGNDTFNVTPGLIPVFVDGGDPVGTSAGDLIVVLANGNPVMFEPGPEPDEGGFVFGGTTGRLSWDHIEEVGPVFAADFGGHRRHQRR